MMASKGQVFFSQNEYIEALNPNLTTFEDGNFKEVKPHFKLNGAIIC